MKKRFVLVLFLLIGFSTYLFCYSIKEASSSGENIGSVSGRFMALGGTSIMGETWTNPSLLSCGSGFSITVGGAVVKSGERRKKSIFDSFDNRIGDVTIADNSFIFPEFSYVSLSYASSFGFGIGIHFLPVVSYEYRYSREVRDNFYLLQETIIDRGSGSTYLGNGGVSYDLLKDRISFGIGFNLYQGKRESEFDQDFVDPEQTDVHDEMSRDIEGNGAVFGLRLHLFQRITAAGFLSTKATLSDYEGDYIPMRAGGGFLVHPPNSFPALFVVDGCIERWNDVRTEYSDVYKVHFGIEHGFTPTFDGRFGFGYETSYISRDIPKVFFTFGFGYTVNRFIIDTGIKVSKVNFSAEDVTIDQRDMDGVEIVEESLVKILVSIRYRR
jgi:hypothetical protein